MERLEGDRVVLRAYTLADAEFARRWKNDPETTRWMGPRFGVAVTADAARQSLRRALDTPIDEARFFAIADRTTDRYLGGIDLTDLDLTRGRRAVLSMVIGQASDRGKGYGDEAVRLLLAFAFDTLGLGEVKLRVYEKNQQALRCYLRNGFQPEGRFQDHAVIEGKPCDLILMGIDEPRYREGLQKAKGWHDRGGREGR